MTSDQSLQFLEHLRRNDHLVKSAASNGQGGEQDVWAARLGPASQALGIDEAFGERFRRRSGPLSGLERVTLQELLSAPALNETFSQRFLREMTVFPFQAPTAALR